MLRETGAYLDDDRTLAFAGEADMHPGSAKLIQNNSDLPKDSPPSLWQA